MINITFIQQDGQIGLKVTGHSESDEKGKDLVCASASMLAYTIAQYIDEAAQEGQLEEEPIIVLSSGDSIIKCCPTISAYLDILHAFKVIQVGYNLLAYNYPQFVALTMFGEGEQP